MLRIVKKEEISSLDMNLIDLRSEKEIAKDPMIREDATNIVWSPDTPAFVKLFGEYVSKFKADAPIVLMCASGKRAYKAAKTIKEHFPDLTDRLAVYQGSAGDWYGVGLQRLRNRLHVRLLYDKDGSWTNTFIVADREAKECVLIDSVKERVDRDLQVIEQLGYDLKYVVETHAHADHITGSQIIRERLPGVKHVIGKAYGLEPRDDLIQVGAGDIIEFGVLYLAVIETPGHTAGCVSYYTSDMSRVFTGDAIMVRKCGRTDFQQGNAAQLHESIKRLYTLPDDTVVLSAHDYNGHTESTIREEKQFNTRVKEDTKEENFVDQMQEVTSKLPKPKLLDVAVPANLKLGQE